MFADAFTLVTQHGTSTVWLHLPDGWVPTAWDVSDGNYLTLLSVYKDDIDNSTDPSDISSLLMQSASAAKLSSSRRKHASRSMERSHASRDSPSPPATSSHPPRSSSRSHTTKRASNSGNSTNAAISDAILKAREDISELTRSLREASSDHSRASTAHHASRSLRLPSHLRTPERLHGGSQRYSGASSASARVERLIAMQQQIDGLSASVSDIQEALAIVRSGLVEALTGVTNFHYL